MSQLLIESIVLDCSNKQSIQKRTDLYENLEEGKVIYEGKEFNCLGVYRVPISRPGEMNKNKRLYTVETWSTPLSKGEGENSLGLINHPEQGASPNLHDAFCVWRNHKVEMGENNKPIVRSDMYLLNNPNGQHIKSIIEAGGKVELSTRGYGEIKESGEVYGYCFKSIDGVYEGSYGVSFGKNEEKKIAQPSYTEKKESINKKEQITEDKKQSIIELKDTNNKKTGEGLMNKIIVKRLIEESLNKTNHFKAFVELNELGESIKADEGLKDEYKVIQESVSKLSKVLEQDYQGDSNDNGSADEDNDASVDPENKIADTQEPIPQDVDQEDEEDLDQSEEQDRTGDLGVQAGNARKSMDYEVMSGEVMSIHQGIKEDTDEEEPDMVQDIDVDPIEDTGVEAEANKVAAEAEPEVTEEDLKKMTKEDLINVIKYLNEAAGELQNKFSFERALFDTLSEQYLKLESYTGKAEQVVEMDKGLKEKAQSEVTESVEYLKQVKSEYDALIERVSGQQEYIKKLEESLHEVTSNVEDKNKVTPYVNEALKVNPQLTPFEKEIKQAGSITEARELMEKYNSMSSKVRLDRVLTTTEIKENSDDRQSLSEGRKYLKDRHWL